MRLIRMLSIRVRPTRKSRVDTRNGSLRSAIDRPRNFSTVRIHAQYIPRLRVCVHARLRAHVPCA